jgi:hypothetical protein
MGGALGLDGGVCERVGTMAYIFHSSSSASTSL